MNTCPFEIHPAMNQTHGFKLIDAEAYPERGVFPTCEALCDVLAPR